MTKKKSLLKQKTHWSFPIKYNYPEYLDEYLDELIGINKNYSKTKREKFIQLLFNSFSLDINEKKRVIDEYLNLTLEQLDGLKEVFLEEYDKFILLEKEHPCDIEKLLTKRNIEWVFTLKHTEDLDLILLDLFYHGDLDDNAFNQCLHYIKTTNQEESCFIKIFEAKKNNLNIQYNHWNTYLNCLSIEGQYKKLSNVILPENKYTLFLEACRCSYLLNVGAFEYINKQHIKNIFKYIRSIKEKAIKTQFIESLSLYYLYKNKNIDKYIHRLTRLFINASQQDLLRINNYHWVSSYTHYLLDILLLPFPGIEEIRSTALKHNFLLLERWLNVFEAGNNQSEILDLYIENKSNISSMAASFLMCEDTQKHYFDIINRHKKLTSPLFGDIIFQINNFDNTDYLKHSIDFFIKDNEIKDSIINNLYLYLYSQGKKEIAHYLLKKYEENKPVPFKKTLILITKATPSKETLFKCSMLVFKQINDNIERYKLNSSFEEYQESIKAEKEDTSLDALPLKK